MPAPKLRFSIKAAIASHLGEDSAEIEQRRYQPTRTPCPVYTVDNDYLTATSSPQRKPREAEGWRWKPIKASGYVRVAGWQIWQRR